VAGAELRPAEANKRVIFLGPPGAGKGTQAQRLAAWLELPKISTGDMLRDHITRDTEIGREARPIMERGGLVPDALLIAMIRARIADSDSERGFILDGFPRTLPQAESLAELVPEGAAAFDVIKLEVPREELLNRLSSRRRDDDTGPAVLRRLQEYDERTRPVVDYLSSRARFHRVDGVGDVESVQAEIRQRLEGRP
jgi:adenylate kinase